MNQTANNENLIEKQVLAFAEAWNKHDAKALAELYAEDGDFVDFMGHLAQRSAGSRAGARGDLQNRDAREPGNHFRNQHALYQTGCRRRALRLDARRAIDAGGETVPPRRGRLLIVIHQTGEKWQIVSSQNTEMFEQPNFK